MEKTVFSFKPVISISVGSSSISRKLIHVRGIVKETPLGSTRMKITKLAPFTGPIRLNFEPIRFFIVGFGVHSSSGRTYENGTPFSLVLFESNWPQVGWLCFYFLRTANHRMFSRFFCDLKVLFLSRSTQGKVRYIDSEQNID